MVTGRVAIQGFQSEPGFQHCWPPFIPLSSAPPPTSWPSLMHLPQLMSHLLQQVMDTTTPQCSHWHIDPCGKHVSEWNHHFHKCISFLKTLPTNTTHQSNITQVYFYTSSLRTQENTFPIHTTSIVLKFLLNGEKMLFIISEERLTNLIFWSQI